jgi:large subunit ribosomal protein L9
MNSLTKTHMSKRIEVVFKEDVASVAKAGEAKAVAGGFWRNFLFPRGLAVLSESKEGRALLKKRKTAQEVDKIKDITPPAKETKARRRKRKAQRKEKEMKKAARLRVRGV